MCVLLDVPDISQVDTQTKMQIGWHHLTMTMLVGLSWVFSLEPRVRHCWLETGLLLQAGARRARACAWDIIAAQRFWAGWAVVLSWRRWHSDGHEPWCIPVLLPASSCILLQPAGVQKHWQIYACIVHTIAVLEVSTIEIKGWTACLAWTASGVQEWKPNYVKRSSPDHIFPPLLAALYKRL